MKWTTLTFVTIGSLAAFYVVLSAPGAILAAVMANPMFSAVGNILIIGMAYSLVPLIVRRVGAVTLWALIVGVLFIPLPLAGPPGALIKVVILGGAGLFADIVYRPAHHLNEHSVGVYWGQNGLYIAEMSLNGRKVDAPHIKQWIKEAKRFRRRNYTPVQKEVIRRVNEGKINNWSEINSIVYD